MKRCYKGCPNRQRDRFVRCEQCQKLEYRKKLRSDWWKKKKLEEVVELDARFSDQLLD